MVAYLVSLYEQAANSYMGMDISAKPRGVAWTLVGYLRWVAKSPGRRFARSPRELTNLRRIFKSLGQKAGSRAFFMLLHLSLKSSAVVDDFSLN